MSNVLVNTSAALMAAVKVAKPGDTILLAGGTYSNIVLSGIAAGGVTITSANPGKPAVLTDIMIRGSSGITVAGVDLFAKATVSVGNTFAAISSSDIHFDHVTVHGPAGLGSLTTTSPFGIRDSSNVTVTNSEFYDLWHGINLLDNNGVTITNNSFHDIRTDGVRGGGTSNLTIANNLFTDFHPAAADHTDAIQLWTTNTTASAHDITIQSNVFVRGDGTSANTQGIFLRDEVGNLPFVHVTIADNLIVGANYNGIAVTNATDSAIINNVVVGEADRRSWIAAPSDGGTTVSGNVSTFYKTAFSGNAVALAATDDGATVVHDWLAQHSSFTSAWGGAASVMTALNLHYDTASRQVVPDYLLVSGTAGDDKLFANVNFDSRVEGGAGNDTLTGSVGHTNFLVGGAGDDVYIIKGPGDVVVEDANGGNDTVYTSIDYTLGANVETLRLQVGDLTGIGNELDNRIVGSAGADHIWGMGGNDTIQGLAGNDEIHGGDGNDTIDGGDGDDRIWGDAGDDVITGGAGNDVIDGGAGNDIIDGGAGSDTMTGGAGADVFRFRTADLSPTAVDQIMDFQTGQDHIDLRLIDANILTAKDDAFKFIGTSAFHNIAGELRYVVNGHDTIVSGDINGDGVADFSIVLHNVTSVVGSDFYL